MEKIHKRMGVRRWKKGVLWGGVCILLFLAGGVHIYEGYKLDQDAKAGTPVMEELQKKADTENFRFQILAHPQFESADAKGEIMIANPVENPYKMSVKITLDESDKEIYASEILSPGERIRYAELTDHLDKGEYPATAVFSVLDQETEEVVGAVEAGLVITVKS